MIAVVEESVTVSAPAELIWHLVSDVTRMGEWSPEVRACGWIKGATGPVAGARFTGANRNKHYRWSTSCLVTDASAGRRFAFRVSFAGLPVAEWSYRFSADGGACVVTESWTDRRGRLLRVLGGISTGVWDRETHNRAGMVRTLASLKFAAEAGAAEAAAGG